MYPDYYTNSLISDSNNPVYFQRYCRKKNQGNTGQNKYFLVAEYQLNPNQSTSATIDISELFACCSYYVPRTSFTGPSWCLLGINARCGDPNNSFYCEGRYLTPKMDDIDFYLKHDAMGTYGHRIRLYAYTVEYYTEILLQSLNFGAVPSSQRLKRIMYTEETEQTKEEIESSGGDALKIITTL